MVNNNGIAAYVLVFVDDLIVTGNTPPFISLFIQKLNTAFSLKDLGDLNFFPGIEVQRSQNTLFLSQRKYIADFLTRAKMSEANSISSPAELGSQLLPGGDLMEDASLYWSVVGALQYVTITRPKISYVVNRVCQFMHSPTETH